MIKYILINHRRLYALSSDSMFTAVYNGDEWEGTNVSSYLNLNDKEDSRITEISEEEAKSLIVRGVAEPISKSFPVEYAVEMNRLINLELEGTIG